MTGASVFDPANPEYLDSLRKLAESAARVGGEVARASFGSDLEISFKDDRSEVTEVDLAAERAIVAHIRAARPHDAFIGEEGVSLADSGGQSVKSALADPRAVCWIIDPIDGTRNYVRGAPFFACSVAAMHGGWPIAGAVFAPMSDAMYSAAVGRGFLINGRATPNRLDNPAPNVADGRMLVGIPSARRKATRHFALHAVEKHVVRNYGSAALHLALLAAGQLDAAVCGNGKLWDIAGGAVLVTESGALITTPQGTPLFPLDLATYAGEDVPTIAGSPAAHARLFAECGGQDAGDRS